MYFVAWCIISWVRIIGHMGHLHTAMCMKVYRSKIKNKTKFNVQYLHQQIKLDNKMCSIIFLKWHIFNWWGFRTYDLRFSGCHQSTKRKKLYFHCIVCLNENTLWYRGIPYILIGEHGSQNSIFWSQEFR